MRYQKIIVLIMTLLWGSSAAFGAERVKIALHPSQAVEQGSGEAVIANGTLTIRVKDLKPHSVYTVWYVNTAPEHMTSGVGQRPYMFKTDRRGVATFRAKLEEQPFGTWQMLVIIRHPNGDLQDMQHKEDALWASLAKADGTTAANPCAAGR